MTDTKREIKFRAWDELTKKFISQSITMDLEVTIRFDGVFVSDDLSIDGTESGDRIILSQFTGLLDKNGKEIYEGDILRVLYTDWPSQLDKFPELSHEEYLDSLSIVGVVVFSGDRFLVDFKGYGTKSIFEGKFGFKKIIGNIYESKHLIDNTDTKV